MAEADIILCEVAYARPEEQYLIELRLPAGTTALEAVVQSGICARCPEISLETMVVGIFGKLVPGSHRLQNADRVEIYRPLAADPRTARRERVRSKATRR